MQHIAPVMNQVMVEITVACMLNPKNEHFYIGTLTIAKVEKILKGMQDGAADVFWTAYGIAEATYLKQKQEEKKEISFPEIEPQYCPECGCTHEQGYINGVRCPNCDYEA